MINRKMNAIPLFPDALNPAALDLVKQAALIAMFVDHAKTLACVCRGMPVPGRLARAAYTQAGGTFAAPADRLALVRI
ncbi:hypothetical protein [Citrobacter freundii]|uniref:hypothetical protein n=1 Tax=Citrobacter freundii TaxID=546 RepID=UPI00383AE82E